MPVERKKTSSWKIVGLVVLLGYGAMQAWAWWGLSKNTYLNDRRTCREMYAHFSTLVESGDNERMQRALKKLIVSVGTELKSSGNTLADAYIKDPRITVAVNQKLKEACDAKPNMKMRIMIERFAKTASYP